MIHSRSDKMTYIEIATFLQTKIVYLFAYFPVITLAGFLQAWINAKAGDETAKNFGFLTLDPMVHFSLLGFMVLMFPWQLFESNPLVIGFGKIIPSRVDSLSGKWQQLKKGVILFSAAISAFITWMLFSVLAVISSILLSVQASAIPANLTGVSIAFLQLLGGLVRLSSELFFIFFIINIVDVLLYKFDKNGTIRGNVFLRLGLAFVAVMLFAPLVRLIFILIIKILLLKA